jgi:hypothetical protein
MSSKILLSELSALMLQDDGSGYILWGDGGTAEKSLTGRFYSLYSHLDGNVKVTSIKASARGMFIKAEGRTKER